MTGARAIRLLLRLYPRPFRDAYGDEMIAFFAARLQRAQARGGRLAMTALWTRTTFDIARTAAAERLSHRPSTVHPTTTGDHPMSSFLNDLRYAGRRLRKTPVFTLSAIAILAIGIGLNAAVFGLVDTMLYRPAPFTDPDRIVHVYQDSDDGEPSSTSFPAYRDMAAVTDVFAGVAATSPTGAIWESAEGPRDAAITFATASYFPVLGLRASRGRWFAPEHDRVGSEMVAVVSHRAWQGKMAGDPEVIGRTVRLNNQLVTIIGVGPENFNGEAGALVTDFWLSISSTPVGGPYQVTNLERREDHWYQVKARLAPGVPLERARAAMTALAQQLAESFPALNEGRDITVFAYDEVRFHPAGDGDLVAANIGVFIVAGLVLLLACSNLANLLLVRGISRGPEMALREALGAGRGRVVRLMLLEAMLLAALGGGAGMLVAAWALTLIPGLPIPTPGGSLDLAFDVRVLAFGVLLTLVTGLVFGLLPALRTAKSGVAVALRDEGRSHSAGRNVSFLRSGLVVVQVAVSMVLVVGAGLLARSLANASRVNPGVDVSRIAFVGTNLPQGGIVDGFSTVSAEILARVQAIPGVERAALTTRMPVAPGGSTTLIVENYNPAEGTGSVELPFAYVSRDYFQTMGITLIAGRAFTQDERPESERVIVVNEAAAKAYFGGDALDGRIRGQGTDTPWRRVVGVVENVNVRSLQEEPTPMIYFSADQAGLSAFTVVARTQAGADPAALAGPLRNALREVRATLPVTRIGTLESHLGDALAEPRVAAMLLGGFSLLALLLASLGVYAVVAFSVERRTQEIGIRVALGASAGRIIRTVVGESIVAVGVGLGAGLLLAVLAMRGMEGMLFGVAAVDEVTFALASVLLLAAAGTAAFLPARRAMRADPADVLRSQ